MKDPIYERDPAISDGNQLYIRASATDLCSRMLYYSAKGVPKTDDTPADTQVMFDLGNYLEAFVKDTMAKHHGWTFQGLDPYTVYMPISQSLVVTGHPDAIGMCERTGDMLTTVEIKTRGDGMFNNVTSRGNFNAVPGAVYQLAMYRHVLVETGTVEPEVDSCIATMNRDSGQLHQEWFAPNRLEEALAVLQEELQEDINRWDEGVPPIYLPPDHYQCVSCKWRTHCGNIVVDGATIAGVPTEQLARTIQAWEPYKLAEQVNTMPKEVHEDTRAMALAFMLDNRLEKMPVAGESFAWNISKRQRNGVKLNEDKVRYLLGPVQYDQCLEEWEGEPYVEIRKGKAL